MFTSVFSCLAKNLNTIGTTKAPIVALLALLTSLIKTLNYPFGQGGIPP